MDWLETLVGKLKKKTWFPYPCIRKIETCNLEGFYQNTIIPDHKLFWQGMPWEMVDVHQEALKKIKKHKTTHRIKKKKKKGAPIFTSHTISLIMGTKMSLLQWVKTAVRKFSNQRSEIQKSDEWKLQKRELPKMNHIGTENSWYSIGFSNLKKEVGVWPPWRVKLHKMNIKVYANRQPPIIKTLQCCYFWAWMDHVW